MSLFQPDVVAAHRHYGGAASYRQHLGFEEQMHPAMTFAMLIRGDLRLVLSAPGGGPGGGQAMPDGTMLSFIAGFYNALRRHSRLGNLSPAAYQRMITTQNEVSG